MEWRECVTRTESAVDRPSGRGKSLGARRHREPDVDGGTGPFGPQGLSGGSSRARGARHRPRRVVGIAPRTSCGQRPYALRRSPGHRREVPAVPDTAGPAASAADVTDAKIVGQA
ncbi:hypothetical protein Shyhy02_16810 [Streptomyces hygroscopicus subsp. hygroscopicus]|nr:hypothetical protein Shyhy02_16810 [Streptomyces hygroscopicus subsp. hygroscopicus]